MLHVSCWEENWNKVAHAHLKLFILSMIAASLVAGVYQRRVVSVVSPRGQWSPAPSDDHKTHVTSYRLRRGRSCDGYPQNGRNVMLT